MLVRRHDGNDLLEEVLGPHDAVDGLGRRVPDGAPREGLLGGLGLTLVALGESLGSEGRQGTR